eukprot:CAMPEP_0173061360 /NCGR_PEP_ID=MMETSP1102-20130122/3168_1 /TAXON_ID=49646 /ORGANISM="Geminigera sp., Strain Caron Lab Isolate" /LENGTH=350 /DNA_ID=CAMNT_0013927809 /DNA_START=247 /DNA_END=1299 /DNA_ORIENTATION=+
MKTISSVAANTLVLAVTLLNVGTAAAFTVSPLQASRVQYPTLAGRAARPQRSGIAMAAGSSSQVLALVAFGKAQKAAVIVVPLVVALPTAQALVAVCTVPTLLGYWKSEYGVSYAYALATMAAGLLIVKAANTQVAAMHAGCLILYGLRLGLFLLYRETSIQRFREFREKIEARASEKGSRLGRTPFILGCSFLYLGLAAPLMVTAPAAVMHPAAAVTVGCMYLGWAIAVIGDLQKTFAKARDGPDALVTGGLFSLLRHPNYTGEMLLWTSSVVTAFVTAVATGTVATAGGWLVLSVLGAVGINFVLLQASTGLEKKQKEKYGAETSPSKDAYGAWTKNVWSGPVLPQKS